MKTMTLETVAIVLLVLLLFGLFPGWSHARWGYGPVGMIVLILVMMFLLRAI